MEEEQIPIAKPVETMPQAPMHPGASGRAVASLVLGIMSLICMGFLTGIPAIILGSMELRAIKAGQAPLAGEGVAKVGYILGIVGTVMTCLAVLALFAFIAFGISLGAFNEIAQSV